LASPSPRRRACAHGKDIVMKTARIVAVRDATPPPADRPAAIGGETASTTRMDRMAELLRRYPDVDRDERAELLAFLRDGRHLEIGLVGARDGLAPQVARFRRDHRAELGATPLQLLGFLVLVLGPLGLLAWACIS
jgi:hypothetical protein